MITAKLAPKQARAALADLLPHMPWFAKDSTAQLIERGRPISIMLAEVQPKRTDSQNAFYWVLVDCLAKALGYSKQGLHEVLLAELHGADEFVIEDRVYRKPRGRSHNLDVQSFGELIETAYRVAAFAGVILPTPEEVS